MITKHEDKSLKTAPQSDSELGPSARSAQAAVIALEKFVAGRPCPHCGTAGKHCRPVSSVSYWCQQSGLLAAEAAYVHTELDPQAEAVKRDGQRNVAEVLRADAQRAFEAADATWQRASEAVETAKRKIGSDKGSFSGARGWRPSAGTAPLAKSLPALEAKADDAYRARLVAEQALDLANAELIRANDDALERAGLPRVAGNVRGSESTRAIAGYFQQ